MDIIRPTAAVDLFDGDDIVVRGAFPPSARALVITFSSRNPNLVSGKRRREGFGERFLDEIGVAYICIINKDNHWWQTSEIQRAAAQIASLHDLGSYERIVSYGASMGAYGALAFAGQFSVDTVLAFSPQFSISGDPLPIHPIWAKDMAGREIMLEPLRERLGCGQIIAIFDPLETIDLAHVRALETAYPSTERVVVPFSGHSTALFIHNIDLLKAMVLESLERRFDVSAFRRKLRIERMNSWRYLTARARKRRFGHSSSVNQAIVDLLIRDTRCSADERGAVAGYHLSTLLAAGQPDEALRLCQAWQEAFPGEAEAYACASAVLEERGRTKAAALEMRNAVRLDPRNSKTRLRLVQLLVRCGRLDGAGYHLERALQNPKAIDTSEWLRTAEVFRSVGAHDLAAKAAQPSLVVVDGAVTS